MINFAPFGGCGLHNPVGSLRRLKVAESVFGQMGFQNSPFSLSANANLQLLDFVTGNLDIPEWIRRLTYADRSHRPSDAQGAAIHDSDIVLVEMSTPIEYLFDSHLLNINLFEEVMLQELASLASHKKLISSWRSSLLAAVWGGCCYLLLYCACLIGSSAGYGAHPPTVRFSAVSW